MKNTFSIGKPLSIKFHRINNASTSDKLFNGFDDLYFVSFATSLRALLNLFNTHQFQKVQGIIGDSMTDQFKDELKNDQKQVLEILEKIKNGQWSIYIRKKKKAVIHDKFYLLKNKESIRVIIGSANLTESGLYGRNQKNIVVVMDYDLNGTEENIQQNLFDMKVVNAGNCNLNGTTENEKAIQDFYDYFNDSENDCELFMEDLITTLEKEGDEDKNREKMINRWLNVSNEEFKERELKKFIKDVNERALEHITDDTEKQVNFTIELPENQDAQKRLEKIYPKTAFERTADNKIIVPGNRYFKWMKESIQYPLMYIKKEENKNLMYLFTDKFYCRTTEPQSPEEVSKALQNLEDFCNTVDLGQTENPNRAKMIFYEAILYFLNAPFSHELMKVKKETVGIADDSGLQYLFICGPGGNSKTQLVRFMLNVLTGQLITPLPVEQFTKAKVRTISTLGTLFPIVADDVKGEKLGAREDLLKNYWEKDWNEDNDCPQMILTTNYRNILNKPWATRRIKGLDFEVVFKKKHENSRKLNQIMAEDNPIFKYFSFFFLNKIQIRDSFRIEDELNVSRQIMKQLYKYANRDLPTYFPDKPVEEKYDKNLEEWQKIIKLDKAKIEYKNDSVHILFPSDMNFEKRKHLNALPQELVAEIHGNTIVINNKPGFEKWIGVESSKQGLWGKLKSYLS
jgi:hypothetical protein